MRRDEYNNCTYRVIFRNEFASYNLTFESIRFVLY